MLPFYFTVGDLKDSLEVLAFSCALNKVWQHNMILRSSRRRKYFTWSLQLGQSPYFTASLDFLQDSLSQILISTVQIPLSLLSRPHSCNQMLICYWSSHCVPVLAVIFHCCGFNRCMCMAVGWGRFSASCTERAQLSPTHGTVRNLWVLTGTPACMATDRAALWRWSVLPVW